jgi:hypothetical protein
MRIAIDMPLDAQRVAAGRYRKARARVEIEHCLDAHGRRHALH